MNNLALFRKQRKLTQNDISKLISMSQSNYGKIERGEVELTQQQLIILSKFYNTSVDSLLGFDINSIDPKTPEAKLTISISKNLVKLSEKELQVIDQLVKTMIDD